MIEDRYVTLAMINLLWTAMMLYPLMCVPFHPFSNERDKVSLVLFHGTLKSDLV